MEKIFKLQSLCNNFSLLYVEDDHKLREKTASIFKKLFQNVDLAENGQIALELYKDYKDETNRYYDIVISDIKMPKMDGVLLSKEIIKINPKQKIIITSAYDDKEYFIDLINIGISGFFKKPIEPENMFQVLTNVSQSIHGENIYTLSEGLTYDLNNHTLLENDNIIDLTPNEKKLLTLFCTNPNIYFSTVEIFNFVYYEDIQKEFSADSIKSLIKRLRKKLPVELIVNSPKEGYSLTSTVV